LDIGWVQDFIRMKRCLNVLEQEFNFMPLEQIRLVIKIDEKKFLLIF
jgi:hypothetical protein